jgi:predicted glycosyltransferase
MPGIPSVRNQVAFQLGADESDVTLHAIKDMQPDVIFAHLAGDVFLVRFDPMGLLTQLYKVATI